MADQLAALPAQIARRRAGIDRRSAHAAGQNFSAAWSGEVGVHIEPGCGMYSLRFLISGDYRYADGRNTFCCQPNLFIAPDQPFRGKFRDIRLLFVDLSSATLERALGVAPPGGIGLHSLDPGLAAPLRNTAFAAMRELELLPATLRPKFLRNFQSTTAAALAQLLREILPAPRRPDPMIGRRKVADLRDWAHLDHEEPITIGDLAARCGLGLRALQKNFLRHFDTTPHLYLRHLRLDKVRRLLQDASANWSVTAAALEAGFPHLGRFSLSYREKFGESPRDTLRRTQQS